LPYKKKEDKAAQMREYRESQRNLALLKKELIQLLSLAVQRELAPEIKQISRISDPVERKKAEDQLIHSLRKALDSAMEEKE